MTTAARPKRLSVCCMSSGGSPGRLAAILSLLRPLANEIVVAVEEPRALDAHTAVGAIADCILAFPPTQPSDRPIAWLFRRCAGDWILNVDDDEVPSARLLEELPGVLARDDITHGWLPRRWLYPTTGQFLDEPPWSNEFQLRLLSADTRFLQFSDLFHLPIVAQGPGVYLDAPLWHLDTVLNPTARRHAKASAYELERPGMRIAGRSHNHALYVPELTPQARVAPVPGADLRLIEGVLAGEVRFVGERRAGLVRASSAEIDANWPGAPFGEALHRGAIEMMAMPPSLRAGVQETIDARVTNGSDRTWRWGRDARPQIRLAYRWSSDGETVQEPLALRTVLPADLRPGATEVVPVHVVPPQRPGRYALQLEIVHEGLCVFASTPSVELDVAARERIALIGMPADVLELLTRLALSPSVEPTVVLGNDSDRGAYGDYACVSGLRAPLLEGLESSHGLGLIIQLCWRSARLVRQARRHRSRDDGDVTRLGALFDLLRHSDGLLVAGSDWGADAAAGREWWRLMTTLLVGRVSGCAVYVAKRAVSPTSGLRGVVLRRAMCRLSAPIDSFAPAARHDAGAPGDG